MVGGKGNSKSKGSGIVGVGLPSDMGDYTPLFATMLQLCNVAKTFRVFEKKKLQNSCRYVAFEWRTVTLRYC